MDREAWRAVIHGVPKSQTWLSDSTELNFIFHHFGISQGYMISSSSVKWKLSGNNIHPPHPSFKTTHVFLCAVCAPEQWQMLEDLRGEFPKPSVWPPRSWTWVKKKWTRITFKFPKFGQRVKVVILVILSFYSQIELNQFLRQSVFTLCIRNKRKTCFLLANYFLLYLYFMWNLLLSQVLKL